MKVTIVAKASATIIEYQMPSSPQISGKIKTASTMIGLCVLMAFPTVDLLAVIVNGVIVITTVYSGIEYFVQNWNCLWDK